MANVMTKQEREEFVKKMFEPTIDNAIKDMRMSKLLFLTKDNKFYSSVFGQMLELGYLGAPYEIYLKKD